MLLLKTNIIFVCYPRERIHLNYSLSWLDRREREGTTSNFGTLLSKIQQNPRDMAPLNLWLGPARILTAVKCKKLRHFRYFSALKFESVQTFTSTKFV